MSLVDDARITNTVAPISANCVEWKVGLFGVLKSQFPDEQSLDSPMFEIDEATWYLKIFPNGFSKADDNHASLYLYAERFPDGVSAVAVQGIIEVEQIGMTKKLNHEHEQDRLFSPKIMSWGFHNFASHVELAGLELVIRARVEITGLLVTPRSSRAPATALVKRMENLLKTGWDGGEGAKACHCDIMFRCKDGEQLHAHKSILSSACEVFKAMFEHDMQENQTNIVQVEDTHVYAMKAFLIYLYTQQLHPTNSVVVPGMYYGAKAEEVLALADRYCCTDYMLRILEDLTTNLTVNNVVKTIKILEAYKHLEKARLIFKSVLRFASQNLQTLRSRPDFADLPASLQYCLELIG